MKREELLKAIETTVIAIDKSGSPTGMDFLVFDEGWIRGFNDVLSISYPIATGVTGAIKAHELLKVLNKMEGESIRISNEKDGKILIKDAKTTLKMTQMEESSLTQLQDHISSLKTDGIKWGQISKRFIDGLTTCLYSAGVAPELGALAGVAFKEGFILSTDNYRITMFQTDEPVPTPFVLPTEVANGVKNFKGEFSGLYVDEAWVHFKGLGGMVVSARRLMDEYPFDNVIELFKQNFPKSKGQKPYILPPGIIKAIERAEILAGVGEEGLDFLTQIELSREGKFLKVRGEKEIGEVEDKVLWEEGASFPEKLKLKVSPTFLKKVIGMTNNFQLSENKTTILFEGEFFKHLMVAKISE